MFRRLVLLVAALGAAWYLNSSLTATLAVLLGLITVHEAGHYLAARIVGVGAPEFAVGFGPTIVSRQGKKTLWSLRAIPLGGYVRLSGQGGDGDDWERAKPHQRMFIAAAGPAVNIVVGVVMFFLAFLMAGQTETTGRIGAVVSNSAAASAGIVAGERIVSVNGVVTQTFTEAVMALGRSDDTVRLVVEAADGARRDLTVTMRRTTDGRRLLGVRPETTQRDLGVVGSAREAASTTVHNVTTDVSQVGAIAKVLVTSPLRLVGVMPLPEADERALSPVGLATIAESSATDAGAAGVLWLIGVVSIFLGVFNLLPVTPLDGGKIVAEPLAYLGRKLRLTGSFASLRAAFGMAVFALLLVGGLSSMLLDILNPLTLP